MAMDDTTWAKHANPYSVYSRFTVLPLLSGAAWSREILGYYCVIPIALALLWMWLNPRVFGVPADTRNWASMGTFGERIYLNRSQIPIPLRHQQTAAVLQLLSALGVPLFIAGLITLEFWLLVLGNLWIMVFKAWFVDRMVWLFMDMKDDHPQYHAWLKP